MMDRDELAALDAAATKGTPLSWTDAGILAGAVLGILIGISLLSIQAAAVMGILILAFVVFKLFTTKA